MNTQNDSETAKDFETLYLAYRAKYEAAIRDAERYRWIRLARARESETVLDIPSKNPLIFDAAVDAAMASMLD